MRKILISVLGLIILSGFASAEMKIISGSLEDGAYDPDGKLQMSFTPNDGFSTIEINGDLSEGSIDLSVDCINYEMIKTINGSFSGGYGQIELQLDGRYYQGILFGHCNDILDGETITTIEGSMIGEDEDGSVINGWFYSQLLIDDEQVVDGLFMARIYKDSKLDNQETRLSALETWKQAISTTMSSLQSQLETLKDWLFFWNNEENNICATIADECDGSVACTNMCSAESVGCVDETTRWFCQMQDDGCYDKIGESCSQDETCDNGVCSQSSSKIVIFRTNAINGNYGSGTWIAVDTNNDGQLEGYDYTGSSGILSSCKGEIILQTPEGLDVYLENGQVYICMTAGAKFSYKKYYSISTVAVTSSEPIEGYSQKNQEVYAANSEQSQDIDNDDEHSVDVKIPLVPGVH
jgi:hypothetical protein